MKSKNAHRFMPDGNTPVEKAYALFRYHCGIIADRTRKHKRCRSCFTRGFVGGKNGKRRVRFGCDGCSEMHDLIQEARELFARKETEGGEGVTKG